MTPTRSDILKYLSDARAHYAAYHNHKEVSAWAGVVLHVLFMAQLAFARDDLLKAPVVVVGAWTLVVFLSLVMLLYLHTQFSLRHHAANCVAATICLAGEYLTDDGSIKAEDWQIAAHADPAHHSPSILPEIVLAKAKKMDATGHGDRRRLEFVGFSIVVVTSLAAAARLGFR